MSMANMKRSETTEQMGLFRWANNHVHVLPELRWMYHVPNEGKRTNGNILKAAGLKSGVPDICLPIPRNGFHGLYIEMKYGKNKATKEQKEYLAALDEYAYKTAICYGAQEAMETIVDYLQTPDGQNLYVCLDAPWIGGCCCGKMLANSRFIPDPACEGCQRLEELEKRSEWESILDAMGKDVSQVIKFHFQKLAMGPCYVEQTELEEILQEIVDAAAAEHKMDRITFDQAARITDLAMETYQSGQKYKNTKGI